MDAPPTVRGYRDRRDEMLAKVRSYFASNITQPPTVEQLKQLFLSLAFGPFRRSVLTWMQETMDGLVDLDGEWV